MRSRLASSFIGQGMPSAQAHSEASRVSQMFNGSGGGGGNAAAIPRFVQVDFADATRTVLYVMAGVMGFACPVALRGLPRRVPAPAPNPALGEN